jgi:hypothetical protein
LSTLVFLPAILLSFFTLLLTLLLNLGISITMPGVALLFAAALGISVAARRWLAPVNPAPALTRRDWLVLGAFFLVVLPGILAMLLSPRVQIANHGTFHSAYIYEILVNQIPPENVTFPGFPANFYWPYYAVLAVIAYAFNVAPPMASMIFNLSLLAACTFLGIRFISLLFEKKPALPAPLLGSFALFCGNLFVVVHHEIESAFALPGWVGVILENADHRLDTLIRKYFGFGGFPLGMLIFLTVAILMLEVIKDGFDRFKVFLIVILTLGALQLHATTGLFIAGVLVPAFGLTLLAQWWGNREPTGWLPSLKEPATLGLIALMLLFAWPTVSFLLETSRGLSGGGNLARPSVKDISSIIISFYPIVILVAVGMWLGWKEKSLPSLFLGLTVIGGFAVTGITNLSGDNEYKFVYLATIAGGFLATSALVMLWQRKPAFWKIVPLLFIGLVSYNLYVLSSERIKDERFENTTFWYEDGRILAEPGEDEQYLDLYYADIYIWARENTPADTIIVIPHIYMYKSSLLLLAERLPYVVDGKAYNNYLPGYWDRTENATRFYKSGADLEEKLTILNAIQEEFADRPILIVYPQNLSAKGLLVDEQIVFRGVYANAYLLIPAAP